VRKACLICGKGVLGRHYRSHLKTHRTDRARYSCDLCAAQLTRRNDVRRHKSLVHTRERQVQCALCTRFFVKEMFLKRHLNARGEGGTTTTTTSLVCATCRAKKSYVEENRAFDKEDLTQNEMVQTRQFAEDRLAAVGPPLSKALSGESVHGDPISCVRHKGSSEERSTASAPSEVNPSEDERNILEVPSISEDILMFTDTSSPQNNDKEKVLLEEQDGEDSCKAGMSQVGKKRAFLCVRISEFFYMSKKLHLFFVV
jgi:hypothetical protein